MQGEVLKPGDIFGHPVINNKRIESVILALGGGEDGVSKQFLREITVDVSLHLCQTL